jgi:histidine ammonia-lyase
MLVRDGDELIDVVNKHRGQGVLNFLALDGVVEQVDAGIHELRPREGDVDVTEAATAAR